MQQKQAAPKSDKKIDIVFKKHRNTRILAADSIQSFKQPTSWVDIAKFLDIYFHKMYDLGSPYQPTVENTPTLSTEFHNTY